MCPRLLHRRGIVSNFFWRSTKANTKTVNGFCLT